MRSSEPRPIALSTLLSVGFGGYVLLVSAIILVLALGAAQRNTLDLLRLHGITIVDVLEARADGFIGTVKGQLRFLAREVEQGRLDPDRESQLIDRISGAFAGVPQVSGIAFARPDGSSIRLGRTPDGFVILRTGAGGVPTDSMVARTADGTDALMTSIGAEPSIRGIQDRRSYVLWLDAANAPVIGLVEAVRRDDVFLGRFGALVSVDALSRDMSTVGDRFGGRAFMLYGRDRVLAHPALAVIPGLGSAEEPLPGIDEIGDAALSGFGNPATVDLDGLFADDRTRGKVFMVGGREFVTVYREINGVGQEPWIVGLLAPNEVFNQQVSRLQLTAWLALGLTVLAAVLALFAGRRLARPFAGLTATADAVARLEFDDYQPLPRSRIKELDEASRAMNAMVVGLRRFGQYVPKRLVRRLIERGEDGVASEEREITVLFCDIAGFTRWCEGRTTAQAAEALNAHFARMADAIRAEGGTIDKYIGDSVMAFWGAPGRQDDHADRACRAALAMVRAADALPAGALGARIRIGVHSGPALVGNIGAPGRINYTVVGDTVNIAQRLETLGKSEGKAASPVLISDATYTQLTTCTAILALGCQTLRGRKEEICVYELNGFDAGGRP